MLRCSLCVTLLLLASCNENAPTQLPSSPSSATAPTPSPGPPPDSPIAARLVDALGRAGASADSLFVYREEPEGTIFALTVTPEDAVELWTRLRAQTASTGHYPLLVHDPEEHLRSSTVEMLSTGTTVETTPKGPSIRETLAAAAAVDTQRFFREHREQYEQDFEFNEFEEDEHLLRHSDKGWSEDEEPSNRFHLLESTKWRTVETVQVLLLPTTSPWEAVAWLRFGDWNACPGDAVHVAMAREWHRTFGAELVCASRDTLEFLVSKPPTTKAAAIGLTTEHFFYCSDIVDQGVGWIGALASILRNGSTWYFWWD